MFRTIQNHPVALLVVGAVAFGAWLWRDAVPAVAARSERADTHPVPPHLMPHGDPHALVAHLPPGLPRSLVEQKLAVHPIPHAVSPVSVEDGSATYTVTYPAPGRPLVLAFDASASGHPFVGARGEPQS